jgi:succinate dehydrogenase / fumarate reductase membrane anchor subunit
MNGMNNDMRTPLGKVRGLGSAKEGTAHFWYQRVTAVALVPLVLFFIGLVISLNGASFAEVRAALSHPLTAIVMALFVLTGVYHMRLGMQVIIEDYVHGEGMKDGAGDAEQLLYGCCRLCLYLCDPQAELRRLIARWLVQ